MHTYGSVLQLLHSKPPAVWTCPPDATVYDAVRLMHIHDIGAIVVIENDQVLGLFTERDYSRKIVLHDRTSRDTFVKDVTDPNFAAVSPHDSVEHCMQLMVEHKIRHLPVIDDGKLIGLISIGDIVHSIIKDQDLTIQHLHSYISGTYPT